MSFNLGAFAGAAATSGMNTYQMLESIESQKKRDALVDLQAQEAKAAAEERAALKGAASSTYGQVGTPETALPGYKMTDAEVANAYAIDQGDPAAVAPKAYTQAQADADYLAKVRGISPERALDIEGKQTQTAIGKSSLARIKAEDDFSTWLQDSQAQAAKDPVGFLKANLNAYNNATKGSHLDDGKTADVVASADGTSFSFVRKDAKGKLVDSTPINPASAGDALKHIAFSKYASLPGKFKESEELGLKGREVAAKEADVKSSGEYRRALGGKASQSQVQVMNEKITSLGAVYRRADPSLSVEAAEKKAAQELVRSPDARAELVTAADVNKFLEANADAPEMKVKGKSGKMELRSLEERTAIARRALGGGVATPAASGKLAQAFAGEGDPFADKKPEAKKAETALPSRPETAPAAGAPRNLYLEQIAQADARRKAAIIDRARRDAEAQEAAALADERAAAGRAAIGANFNTLYGGTR